MKTQTRRIPVNAPTAEMAVSALRDWMTKQRVNVIAIAPAEEQPVLLSFHSVALVVTNKPGKMHTFIVPVEFTR